MYCRKYDGKGVRHTRTGSREASVAETVVCAWNDTYRLRRGPKPRAVNVGKKLNVGSQNTPVFVQPATGALGMQSNLRRTGVICLDGGVLVTRRAAAFCADCIFRNKLLATPHNSELHIQSRWHVINAWTKVFSVYPMSTTKQLDAVV